MVTARNLRSIALYAEETTESEKFLNEILHECENQAYNGKLDCIFENILDRKDIAQVIKDLIYLGFHVYKDKNSMKISWEYKK